VERVAVAAARVAPVLRSLAIRDFVIVDRLELAFDTGFSVLTGETGAGKSILIDALGLLMGDRADPAAVREGCARAELEAEFDLSGEPAARGWLERADLVGDEAACLVRRVIEAGGRSRAFVNGRSVTLAQLRELGEQLVDIHGQHVHQRLVRPAEQRAILDEYGGHGALAAEVAVAWQAWRDAALRRREAERDVASLAERRASLAADLERLDALAFDPAEWEAVNDEHARLAHAESLTEATAAALATIEDGESALLSGLSSALSRLREAAAVDRAAREALELAEGAEAQLKEAARELRHYLDRLELDPRRLQALDARLAAVHEAARRHRVAPAALGELALRLREELGALGVLADPQALAAAESAAGEVYRQAAGRLRRARARAGKTLAEAVTATMQGLAMEGGRFEVALVPAGPAADAPVPGSRHGDESVEFRVAANPGTTPGALGSVASGGELARIGLALRAVASASAPVPVLVFDEVDAGIGGRVAEIVGRLLRELGVGRQTLCVTHLPQVAASARWQYRVAKQVRDGRTTSSVERLPEAERVEEIARMLGGVRIGEATRRHAAEMLEAARAD
jgi:DNA repair protein RecN (Recombination protein N)